MEHEVAGWGLHHLAVEGKDDDSLHSRRLQRGDLLVEPHEALWGTLGAYYLHGVAVECDDNRAKATLGGCTEHTLDDLAVTTVDTIENAYRGGIFFLHNVVLGYAFMMSLEFHASSASGTVP